MPEQTSQPQSLGLGISIGQIFLESAEFAHRSDAITLPASTPAAIGDVTVQITTATTEDENSGFMRLVVATNPALSPIYTVRVSMAALVTRQPGAVLTISEYFQRSGVVLLYPFLREAFASLTARGRFGAVWLQPINPQLIRRELEDATPTVGSTEDGASVAAGSQSPRPPERSATSRRASVKRLKEVKRRRQGR